MKSIGGYFGLELEKGPNTFHTTKALQSGRAALHLILKTVKAKNVYIPFYTCSALLETFIAAQVPYQFYAITENLEPAFLPKLKTNEYFLYVNYFDVKQTTVQKLSDHYGAQLIIDASQAFFNKGNGRSWLFNSCRKFFGVPDGAFIYAPEGWQLTEDNGKNTQYLTEHLLQRFKGNIEEGYPYFQENEVLIGSEIKAMSQLSEHLLSHVNFEQCQQKRKENFLTLHTHLKDSNQFTWEETNEAVPMTYPYLPSKKIRHQTLWEKNFFVPILWKDVIEREGEAYNFEKEFSENLLPLPIDHRYNSDDMAQMLILLSAL